MREIQRRRGPTYEVDGNEYLDRLERKDALWHDIIGEEFGVHDDYCDGDFKLVVWQWCNDGYKADRYKFFTELTDSQLEILATDGDIDCPDDDPQLVEYDKLTEAVKQLGDQFNDHMFWLSADSYAMMEQIRRAIIKDYPEAENMMKKGQLALAFYQ